MRPIAFIAIAVGLGSVITIGVLRFATPKAPKAVPKLAEIKDIKGRLTVLTASSFEVDGTSIVLCGVRPSGTTSAEKAAQSVRLSYENAYVKCKPVGGGTPCDGKTVATLGRFIVAQCKIDGALDLATALTESGILCGTIPIYKSC
ncbi:MULTISPECIES: hypothetical protein [unclassified Mesorhizobium]|uniref:hypothetical protein n=2 Tax=Mesorhizobium TaxID=68287 RepID=UPI0013E36779|nr:MULTISPECIES: hypothetical protein [unclassified Mesorhizobium]